MRFHPAVPLYEPPCGRHSRPCFTRAPIFSIYTHFLGNFHWRAICSTFPVNWDGFTRAMRLFCCRSLRHGQPKERARETAQAFHPVDPAAQRPRQQARPEARPGLRPGHPAC